jgi:cyclic pyranopterin phosphate synthase
MVDVGGKDVTERRAVARAAVRMSAETLDAVRRDLVPLCHPLPLSYVDVAVELDDTVVVLTAEARTSAQTGVEMEAMTAAAVAALTVYDMVKGLERGVTIEAVELLEKSGGRHDWRREA